MNWVIEVLKNGEWQMFETLRGFTPKEADRRFRSYRHTDALPVWRLRPMEEAR